MSDPTLPDNDFNFKNKMARICVGHLRSILTKIKPKPSHRSIVQQVLNASMENLLFVSLEHLMMPKIKPVPHVLMVIQAILKDHSLVKLVWKVKYVEMD